MREPPLGAGEHELTGIIVQQVHSLGWKAALLSESALSINITLRVRVQSLYGSCSFESANPTSMYCPPPVCLQCAAITLRPGRNAARAAALIDVATYRVV